MFDVLHAMTVSSVASEVVIESASCRVSYCFRYSVKVDSHFRGLFETSHKVILSHSFPSAAYSAPIKQ